MNGGDLNQHTLVPDVPATVAPFRAWRSLQIVVTRGPRQVTIEFESLRPTLVEIQAVLVLT